MTLRLLQEERLEASDIVTATLENTSWGATKIATQIKMAYDKSFGAAWQVSPDWSTLQCSPLIGCRTRSS